MTASMFDGEGQNQQVVGNEAKVYLPGQTPMMKQGSQGPTMSDMQFMRDNEIKQHQELYNYENGHNDHGMGQ